MQTHRPSPLRERLDDLVECLSTLDFALPTVGLPERDVLVRSISNYLIPRLDHPDAPLVASIVGLSGTGKSVLINSLAGSEVSQVGAVRPTTVAPVVWASGTHRGPYWSAFVARIRDRIDPALDVVVGDADPLVANLTIIDTPPLDMETPAGGDIADRIAALSDVCVFVTSAGRYADRRAWRFLESVRRRGVPVLFVLNRAGIGALDIREDFVRHLHQEGYVLSNDVESVFAIAESPGSAQRLSPELVATIRNELEQLSDPAFRQRLLSQTAEGAIKALVADSQELAEAAEAEQDVVAELIDHVDRAYRDEADALLRSFGDGSLAWLADYGHWPSAAVDLTGMITRRAGVAAQAAASRWEEHPVGAAVLASGGQGLWRHGHDSTYESQKLLEGWMDTVDEILLRHHRRRPSPRSLERLKEELWPLVLDRERPAGKKIARRLGDELEPVVKEAGEALGLLVRAAMAEDARRFHGMLDVGLDETHAAVVRNAASAVEAAFIATAVGGR